MKTNVLGLIATAVANMSNLAPCDMDLYFSGEVIDITNHVNSGCATDVEAAVREIAKESGAKVDWHYVGGHVALRFMLADYENVCSALASLKAENKLLKV